MRSSAPQEPNRPESDEQRRLTDPPERVQSGDRQSPRGTPPGREADDQHRYREPDEERDGRNAEGGS